MCLGFFPNHGMEFTSHITKIDFYNHQTSEVDLTVLNKKIKKVKL